MRCFLRFFTFSQSIFSTKMNLLHHNSDTRTNDIKRWKTTINSSLWRIQFNFFFFVIVCSSSCVNILRQSIFFVFEFAINQNASINKNSKNSNSRSLKQHTFAKSISFCCFCFVLKNRSFHHINLQISLASIEIKILNKIFTKFSFSSHIYIFFLFAHFLFSIYFFTFIAFAMKLSTSIMIKQIFESQSMNFFAMSIDKKIE